MLDVKTGSGAFMKREQDARALAEEMVEIGRNAGRKTVAVISDMDQPLGYAVGNALEVKEAIDTLSGKGPEDFVELCITLGSQMLLVGGKASLEAEAREMLRGVIADGSALRKFAEFVEAQGGDKEAVYRPERLPKAQIVRAISAPRSGYVSRIVCDEVGLCSLILGGGRERKDSAIDLAVGLVLCRKVWDYVKEGEPLAILHANEEKRALEAEERYLSACTITETIPKPKPLIKTIIG